MRENFGKLAQQIMVTKVLPANLPNFSLTFVCLPILGSFVL